MIIVEEYEKKTRLQITITERLDTSFAVLLERQIKLLGNDTIELVFDFAHLTYISSMGLRVLLQAQKIMNARKGKLIIKNILGAVREVFEMTGFINLFVEEEKLIIIKKADVPDKNVLSLQGQIDYATSLLLEKELRQLDPGDITSVYLDFEKVSAIYTAGYRILLQTLEDIAKTKRVFIQDASEHIQEHIEAAILHGEARKKLQVIRNSDGSQPSLLEIVRNTGI